MPEPSPETLQHWNALAAEKLAGWRVHEGTRSLGWRSAGYCLEPLPDYAHSLDAVAALEAIVRERGERNQAAYLFYLNEWVNQPIRRIGMDHDYTIITAPAHVRLEAVLKACGVEL